MGGGLHAECRGRSGIVGLFLHTECRGESRVFLFITDCRIYFYTRSVAEVTNYRIIEFSSHGVSRKVTDFLCPLIFELSNCFFTRSVVEGHGFLSRDLSFGPTDQREVIIELSNCFFTRSVAEGHELSNYRIFFTRRIAEGHGFFFTLNVGSAEVWVTRRCGCLFLYVRVKIMCISWVSQTSIRR